MEFQRLLSALEKKKLKEATGIYIVEQVGSGQLKVVISQLDFSAT